MSYDYVSSLPAYKETPKAKRDACKRAVLWAIRLHQPCTDKQLSEVLGWPINRVTPRRGELVEDGLVVRTRKDIDSVTKRIVSFWSIQSNNP